MDTTKQTKSAARDVFLYLLMIIVLAFSAISLGTILFQLINIYIPGQAMPAYSGAPRDIMRFPVAALVIMFPALAWVVTFLRRDIIKNPAKREIRIRRWLLYFSLFVTGLILLGDLIALVNGYLQGDLTLRFILKIFAVLMIAGSIFFYFIKDLSNRSPNGRRVVEWVSVVIVAAALVAGFWVAGSPASNRARSNDNQRVGDLQMLESQVINYWQAKQKLPNSLNYLADGTIGGSGPVPLDPKTNQPYEYRVIGPLSYEFCANFETASDNNGPSEPRVAPYYLGKSIGSWQHGVGKTCFDGTIDPDRILPLKR